MVPTTSSLENGEEARREEGDGGPDRRWPLKGAILFAIGVSLVMWVIIVGVIILVG